MNINDVIFIFPASRMDADDSTGTEKNVKQSAEKKEPFGWLWRENLL